MKKVIKKICPGCGKKFIKKYSKQKYCSIPCIGLGNKLKPKICPTCKKEFPPRSSIAKYCSLECARKGGAVGLKTGKNIKCEQCGEIFWGRKARTKKNKNNFCCRKCYIEYMKGKKRKITWPNKKGGAKTTRGFDNQWRKQALERANYKCEYCGATEHLQVHHVIGRRCYSTRFYLPNAVVLCAKHHTFSTDFSAHQNIVEFSRWILERRGQEWWDDLNEHKNNLWHNWKLHLDEIREHLYQNSV